MSLRAQLVGLRGWQRLQDLLHGVEVGVIGEVCEVRDLGLLRAQAFDHI